MHAELLQALHDAGVRTEAMTPSEHAAAEAAWCEVFGPHLQSGGKALQQDKALHAYRQRSVDAWLLIAFRGRVAGTAVKPMGDRTLALRSCGPLIDLQAWHGIEFFITTPDRAWTLIHCHEGFAMGGPYFIDCAWTGDA